MNPPERVYDVIAIGELLVDLIGTHPEGSLEKTPTYERWQGGSPANLARTVALAGGRSALVACVGDDGLGAFLLSELDTAGVDTGMIRRTDQAPTSCVVLSRSAATSEFVAYRHADLQIREEHLSVEKLRKARILHTTAFALSREPARSTIRSVFRSAPDWDVKCSIDMNYAPDIWPDRSEALTVLQDVVSRVSYIKVSDDDIHRLFGSSVTAEQAVNRLHSWGADIACLTRGPDGCLVSWDGGQFLDNVPAPTVQQVADATGAGDAFWGGFLSAQLSGHTPVDAARIGMEVAAQKLQSVGPLSRLNPIDGFSIT